MVNSQFDNASEAMLQSRAECDLEHITLILHSALQQSKVSHTLLLFGFLHGLDVGLPAIPDSLEDFPEITETFPDAGSVGRLTLVAPQGFDCVILDRALGVFRLFGRKWGAGEVIFFVRIERYVI